MRCPSSPRRWPIAKRGSYSRTVDLLLAPVGWVGRLVGLVPLALVQRLGRLLGGIWFHLVPIRRRVVIANLTAALPELDPHRRQRVAADVFRNLATTVLELLWLDRSNHQQLRDLVSIEGLEHYEECRRQGRGVIAVTAHLGNWDLLACSQAARDVPLSIVTKELKTRGLSRLWMERREHAGVKLLPAHGSALAILRALKRGEVVGLVIDQRLPASDGGVEIPFFGRPALTTLAPHVLAQRAKAAIIPVWTVRHADGTHHVTVEKEIPLGQTAEETMRVINSYLERWIRCCPEQWLWLHRRWER